MHTLGLVDCIMLDPVIEFRHFGVNTRNIALNATDTPADETDQRKATILRLAH